MEQDRRSRSRDLPEDPLAWPEPLPPEQTREKVEALRATLQKHPGTAPLRMLELGEALCKEAQTARYLSRLATIWDVDPTGMKLQGQDPLRHENEPLVIEFVGGDLDSSRLTAAIQEFCEDFEPRPEEACPQVSILIRILDELRLGGPFWARAGALGLAHPLALVVLVRNLRRAVAATNLEEDRKRGLVVELHEIAETLRHRLNRNFEVLGPFLGDERIQEAVRFGAEYLLDGWQVVYNGLEHSVYGTLQEL